VQKINHNDSRTGTPWDCRHKSSLVQAETSLLLCQRYIELNPIRVVLAANLADDRWSSDRANALGAPDPLLSPQPLDLALGADDDARRRACRELFRGALDDKPLSDLRLALSTRISRSATTASIGRRNLSQPPKLGSQRVHCARTIPRQSPATLFTEYSADAALCLVYDRKPECSGRITTKIQRSPKPG